MEDLNCFGSHEVLFLTLPSCEMLGSHEGAKWLCVQGSTIWGSSMMSPVFVNSFIIVPPSTLGDLKLWTGLLQAFFLSFFFRSTGAFPVRGETAGTEPIPRVMWKEYFSTRSTSKRDSVHVWFQSVLLIFAKKIDIIGRQWCHFWNKCK